MARVEERKAAGGSIDVTQAAEIGELPTQFGAGDPMTRSRLARTDATLAADTDVPAQPSILDADEEIERGTVVGRYVILSRLGAGGMGVVYAAYDPELDRKVALKLLRAAVGLGTAASLGRTRLLREAQALARLSHPHVVTIHDVGTIGDRVWLAMEYVDGVTLGDWIGARRPRWPAVLEVMRRVGEGLVAAHAAGLVHRDLKPDNIMIGRDGRVRVMDFGLARAAGNFDPEPAPASAASHSLMALPVTQIGAVMGTPAYMAPEQWRGDLADARADQFSFCVTLWEALYGARPFTGDTATNLAVAVLAGELRAPPRDTRVPAWLRRTLARGLQTEPARRFPGMHDLLAALQAGELRKRRQRVALIAAAVALAIAAVPLTLYWKRTQRLAACDAAGAEISALWNDQAQARLTAAMTATNLGYAATTAAKVTPWLDTWAAAWSTTRAEVCREATVDRTRSPALHAGAVACLDERRDEFAALLAVLDEGGADAVQRAVPAVANLTPPSSCTDRAALERLPPLPDDPALRAAVTDLRREVLRVQGLSATGRTQDGLTVAEGLLARAEALGHDPLTVRVRLRVGELAEKRGKLDLAEHTLVRTYVDAGALGADEVAAAAAIQLVYFAGHTRMRFDAAIQWSHAATLLVRRLGKQDDLLGARLDNALAVSHKDQGDFDAAQALYERVVATRERVLGPEHPDVGLAVGNLANVLEARGTSDRALELMRRALAVLEQAYGVDHPSVAQVLNNLGGALMRRERLDEALPLHERALAIREQAYGPGHAEVALSLLNLAIIALERRDLDRARALTERGLEIREAVYGPEHPLVAEALSNLSAIRLRQDATDDAEALAERALAVREKLQGPDHPEVAFTVYNLANIARARGDLATAQARFERVLAIRERRLDPDSRELAEARVVLADILLRRGDAAPARALVDQALPTLERGAADGDGLTAQALRVAADARRLQRDLAGAQTLYERALAIQSALPDKSAGCTTLLGLGRLALDRHQPAAAVPWFEQAVAACEDPDDQTAARTAVEQAKRARPK
ncbi:MAG: serine/threonine protein kinase [Myxococcales bacterium]|nr:serine/threonine protein kinase [Myxococcales bacterium]